MDINTETIITERFPQHLSATECTETLLTFNCAPPLLWRWLCGSPDSTVYTKRVARASRWLRMAFDRIQDFGSQTPSEEIREKRITELINSVTDATIDRALFRDLRERMGCVLNSGLSEVTSGTLCLYRDDKSKKGYPYDLVVIDENEDELTLTFIVIGEADQNLQSIEQELQNRIGDTTEVKTRTSEIIDDLFLPHLQNCILENYTTTFVYIGGKAETTNASMTRGYVIIPMSNFLDSIRESSREFRRFVEGSPNLNASIDHESTEIQNAILMNAGFSNDRRAVSVNDWRFSQRFMVEQRPLLRNNREVVTAIQFASPLEAGIKSMEVGDVV